MTGDWTMKYKLFSLIRCIFAMILTECRSNFKSLNQLSLKCTTRLILACTSTWPLAFWRFFWLDLANINFIKYSIMLKTCGYFHILASALPRSVKIGIWQNHSLGLVSIDLFAKNYQIHSFQELWVVLLTVSALPRSRKSSIWQSFV